jgi:hypothetical protein
VFLFASGLTSFWGLLLFWLGLVRRHFPHSIHPLHTSLGYAVRCVSDGPRAVLLKDIPSVLSEQPRADSSSSALLHDRDNYIWCVPEDSSDVVNIYIHLDEPACLTELVITLQHGGVPPGVQNTPGSSQGIFAPMLKDPKNPVYFHTSPASIDLHAGATLDSLLPVFVGVDLPYAASGTQLTFDLEEDVWHGVNAPTDVASSRSSGQVVMPGEASLRQPTKVYDFYADRDLYAPLSTVDTASSAREFVPGQSVVSVLHVVLHKRKNFTELEDMGMTLGNFAVYGRVGRARGPPSSIPFTPLGPESATDILETVGFSLSRSFSFFLGVFESADS